MEEGEIVHRFSKKAAFSNWKLVVYGCIVIVIPTKGFVQEDNYGLASPVLAKLVGWQPLN